MLYITADIKTKWH